METALAFYDWGRWVVDCPTDGCTNAVGIVQAFADDPELQFGDWIAAGYPPSKAYGVITKAQCENGHWFRIEAPSRETMHEIEEALSGRPDHERMWYPDGHTRAQEAGLPVGVDVEELRERADTATRADAEGEARRERLRRDLIAAGLTINENGTIEGVL